MRFLIARHEGHSQRLAALLPDVPDPQSMTVSELVLRYVEIRSSYVADGGITLKSSTKSILRHLGDRLMREVTCADLDDYIGSLLAQGYSALTVRNQICIVSAALKMAANKGWRGPAPKPALPPVVSRPTRALTADEAQTLYRAVDNAACARFVAIALATGARASAIRDLTWDRVDVQRRMIDFRTAMHRATRRKSRPVVPVTDELLTIIGARAPGLVGRVIDMSTQHVARLIRKAALNAGLGEGISPHTLRRTAATTVVRSLSIADAQRMLGHSMPDVTESRYVKLNVSDLRRAIDVNAPLIRTLAELHPTHPAANESRTDYTFHITDKATGSLVEELARRMKLSGPEAIRLACSAALSCLVAPQHV